MSTVPRIIVLDVETQKGFNDVDRKKFHLLKVSVVCIYDSLTGQYTAFEEKEMLKLEEILKQADLIIGFNILDFDMAELCPIWTSMPRAHSSQPVVSTTTTRAACAFGDFKASKLLGLKRSSK